MRLARTLATLSFCAILLGCGQSTLSEAQVRGVAVDYVSALCRDDSAVVAQLTSRQSEPHGPGELRETLFGSANPFAPASVSVYGVESARASSLVRLEVVDTSAAPHDVDVIVFSEDGVGVVGAVSSADPQ
ncbi:MAG: hypothetical protein Q8K99_05075 [Actinomycetota bacterium]|nr:hypothetical protein [Actinomycetota bacterium]